MPGPPGPDGEPVGTLRLSSLAAGDRPPVQAPITVPRVLESLMAAAGVDSRTG